MPHDLHLQAALAAAKAKHLEQSGFHAAAQTFWRDAATLEEAAIDRSPSRVERARLRKSAALYAMRAGDHSLASEIMRRGQSRADSTTDPPPSS